MQNINQLIINKIKTSHRENSMLIFVNNLISQILLPTD